MAIYTVPYRTLLYRQKNTPYNIKSNRLYQKNYNNTIITETNKPFSLTIAGNELFK